MKNRTVTSLLIIISISALICITSTAQILDKPTSILAENQHIDYEYTPQGTIEVVTTGPVWQPIQFADVTFIDGPILKITLIARLLNSRNLYLLPPWIKLNLKDITFSVKYHFNTQNIPVIKRFTYETKINESGNMSTYTEKHTVIVSGFSGEFRITRAKPFRLTPAQFSFTGTCNDVIIN
jgi:hypothetical protein